MVLEMPPLQSLEGTQFQGYPRFCYCLSGAIEPGFRLFERDHVPIGVLGYAVFVVNHSRNHPPRHLNYGP